MQSAVEALLLITVLTTLSMATIALFDVLIGPMSRRRKLGWCLLVLSLPLIGPILYYRRGAERPRHKRRTKPTDKDGR